MVKVFRSIGTPISNSKSIAGAGDGAVLGGSRVNVPSSNPAISNLSATNAATSTRPSRANVAEGTQQPGVTKKSPFDRASNTTTTLLHRRDFTKLLEALCESLPKGLQQRTWDALQGLYETENVSFAEFQRGVQECLLLEQLLDVVEDLFHAMDQSESGEIQASTLLLVLEATAPPGSQRARNNAHNDVLLLLKEFMMPTAAGVSSNGNVTNCDARATTELFEDRTLRKSDVVDSIFHLIFHP
ncbi:hypothetical protein FI667_g17574, partial [Globisporangium splendens]